MYELLPPELRLQILKHCTKNKVDLINFSLCNKPCHQDVAPLIWGSLRVNWCRLRRTVVKSENMKHTHSLMVFEGSGFYPDNDANKEQQHENAYSNFKLLLTFFDPTRVTTFTFMDFLRSPTVITEGLRLLSKTLPMIQKLVLDNVDERHINWNCILQLKYLQEFRIFGMWKTAVSKNILTSVCSLPNLQKINLRCLKLSRQRAKKVPDTASMVTLDIGGPDTKEYFFKCNLKNLQHLMLISADVSDEDLLFISQLSFLRQLTIRSTNKVTDAGLHHFSKLSLLKCLDITENWEITDAGLTHLLKLSHLRKLTIECHSITDEGILTLCNIATLRYLYLGIRTITNQSLVSLSKLIQLRGLEIYPVTEMAQEGLQYLSKLKDLQFLCLRGCSNIFVEALERAGLPTNCFDRARSCLCRWQYLKAVE